MRLIPLIAASLAAAVLCTAGAEAASAPGDKKKGGGPSFVQLPTLTASVIRGDGRRGVLTVEAGLDIADEGLRRRAVASQPRLRDAYVRFLTAYGPTAPAGAPPDPDVLAASLQRATDQVLGRTGAKVLLGSVMIN